MKRVIEYYWTKKARCRNKGQEFSLTLSDMHFLFYMGRITPDDIGTGKEQYCLARIGDTGGYTRGNCRFLKGKDNWKEWTRNPLYADQKKRAGINGANAIKGKKRAPWTPERRAKFIATMKGKKV